MKGDNYLEWAERMVEGLKANDPTTCGQYFILKEDLKIFFNPKKKKYFVVLNKPVKCYSCGKTVNMVLTLAIAYGKKRSKVFKFCMDCIPNLKNIQCRALERYFMIVVDKPPKYSFPVMIQPPSFRFAYTVTFSEASDNNFRLSDHPFIDDSKAFLSRKTSDMIDSKDFFKKAKISGEGDLKKLRMPIPSNFLSKEPESIPNNRVKLLKSDKDVNDSFLSLVNSEPVIEGSGLLEDKEEKDLLGVKEGDSKKEADK